MHIIIEKQEDNGKSVMCVDRQSRTVRILALDPDHVNVLDSIAQAMKAPKILMVVNESEVEEWLKQGFKRTEQVVLTR